ncbi:MAG: glycosyltransferase family 2 protein [Alphaproteobacteria bacterium]
MQLSPTPLERRKSPFVSLVVPMFNEEEGLKTFFARVYEVMAKIGADYEIVAVDDGSRDGTLAGLKTQRAADPRIKIVALSRNFGKENAMTAGIAYAQGDVVIPIDADLQDPPELIAQFLEKYAQGYDMVYGVRQSRDSDSAGKRLTAGSFYRVFNRLARNKIPENAGDFRLMDRAVVDAFKALPERNRFLKGLFAWVGFKSTGIPFDRQEREAGTTKFNYWRLWNFALDGITSFSTAPLRWWGYIGLCVAALSFLFAFSLILQVLIFGRDVPGYASIMVVVLFLGGMQLLSLGIIGEYLGRLYMESKSRPNFIVREAEGFEPKAQSHGEIDIAARARALMEASRAGIPIENQFDWPQRTTRG